MSESIELGYYLPGQAEGAFPNGTRIVKVRKEQGDLTAIGKKGEVIASHNVADMDVPDKKPGTTYFYFVKWDDFEYPVGVLDWKIGTDT